MVAQVTDVGARGLLWRPSSEVVNGPASVHASCGSVAVGDTTRSLGVEARTGSMGERADSIVANTSARGPTDQVVSCSAQESQPCWEITDPPIRYAVSEGGGISPGPPVVGSAIFPQF